MKSLSTLFSISLIVLCNVTLIAQQSSVADDYLERSPIYDYANAQLSNTANIPDYDSKEQKLKISGTIYMSDGVTPAKDVILYIEQANEHGDFDLREENDKRYVYHRGWIKTDADGKYTFYTFIPGGDRRYRILQQLFPIIKAPNAQEYVLDTFLFDDDPLLTKLCRKRIAKKGDPSRILKPTKKDDIFTVEKDIVLSTGVAVSR